MSMESTFDNRRTEQVGEKQPHFGELHAVAGLALTLPFTPRIREPQKPRSSFGELHAVAGLALTLPVTPRITGSQ